jgi:hypothetical protein
MWQDRQLCSNNASYNQHVQSKIGTGQVLRLMFATRRLCIFVFQKDSNVLRFKYTHIKRHSMTLKYAPAFMLP